MIETGTVNISINENRYIVPAGISVLQAAKLVGIDIPTLCFLENYPPHTSCYICLVQITGISRYMPACATIVVNGGSYTTDGNDIAEARRSALELLLSEHRGDCVAPCQIACPAHADIPEMMLMISEGNFKDAIRIIKENIAMPAIFARICPGYCEKACKRKQFDESLSICALKKIASDIKYLPEILNINKHIAIIGAGVSGLSAAYYLRRAGYKIDLFEKNSKLLSKIRLKYSEEILPGEVIEDEIAEILSTGISVKHENVQITDDFCNQYDAILVSAGIDNDLALEKDDKGHIKVKNYITSQTGIFACGSAVIGNHDPSRSMSSGRFAAGVIDKYFDGTNIPDMQLFSTRLGQLTIEEKELFLSLWQDIAKSSNTTRKTVISDIEEAINEAKRCLQCSCMKKNECKLRDLSISYEASTHRYEHDHKKPFKVDFSHDDIIFESAKCIKCGICVSLSTEDSGVGISFINRGYIVEPAVPFDGNIASALIDTALKCADNCPTGAISRRKNVIRS